MIKNINIKENPVTTILGVILLLVGIGIFIIPLFIVLKAEVVIYIPIGISIIGLCLLLIPDDLKGALSKLVNRKADSI